MGLTYPGAPTHSNCKRLGSLGESEPSGTTSKKLIERNAKIPIVLSRTLRNGKSVTLGELEAYLIVLKVWNFRLAVHCFFCLFSLILRGYQGHLPLDAGHSFCLLIQKRIH